MARRMGLGQHSRLSNQLELASTGLDLLNLMELPRHWLGGRADLMEPNIRGVD